MAGIRLTPMQAEIVWAMWMHEDLVLDLEQGEFPWIYALRKRGSKGGVFYPSTPVVGLMKHEFIVKDPVLARFHLNHKVARVWTSENAK